MSQPSYAPVAAPIVIVGPQFCAPLPIDLAVTQKFFSITDREFSVKNAEGNVVFRVNSVFFNKREGRVLQDAAGNPLITLQGKVKTAHSRWKVYRGDSTDDRDLLFSAKKSHMLQLKTSLDVFLAANTKEDACDFKVKGSFPERSCTIYVGDSSVIVAQMKKQKRLTNMVLGKHGFGVTIYPHVDQAFIVALIIILDEINNKSGGSGGSGGGGESVGSIIEALAAV